MTIVATCSNQPRPSVQKGAKGHQHWSRDVFHLRHAEASRTLCNRDASEWLTMDGVTAQEAESNPHLCERCRAARSLITEA